MHSLKISKQIKTLDTTTLADNLIYYEYHTRHLLSLIKNGIDRESQQFISAYNGFKGELYENIVYELLLQYALTEDEITQFVLKGPHQNLSNQGNQKFGLLMDKSQQIVYKAGYKDVSEYDAMFFTKDSIYYVESTIVQSTIGLRKRLRKKTALLSLLFPKLKVNALIILSDGANGLNKFPSNCTVWVTENLNGEEILEKLVLGKKYQKQPFISHQSEKLIEAKDIKVDYFKYFDTLGWILKKSINNDKTINQNFFMGKVVSMYMDIYSKVYIGYVLKDTFKEIVRDYDISSLNLDGVSEPYIYVTLEKLDDGGYEIIYYARFSNTKLKKIEIGKDDVKLNDKDPKGFTVAEIKFIKHCLKDSNELLSSHIEDIKKTISTWKQN
ncbi:MAG: hypothetical protein PHF17_01950 [Arcobacteraceae bacterium]|nr:hypothetical protein [Arcobacteraceae bacterium]